MSGIATATAAAGGSGYWLPCSTTNLKNIFCKCILNARNYLLAAHSYRRAIFMFEEFFFFAAAAAVATASVGCCYARTEALGIHEHRNLSSSSTATSSASTAFCFLHQSIRLDIFFLSVWLVCDCVYVVYTFVPHATGLLLSYNTEIVWSGNGRVCEHSHTHSHIVLVV